MRLRMSRKTLFGMAVAACTLATSALVAAPAAAETTTVAGPEWSVTLTFPDVQWAGNPCQYLPVTAVVTGANVADWSFGGFVRNVDAEYTDDLDFSALSGSGPGTFDFRHALAVCADWVGSGTVTVSGEVGVRVTGSPAWAWVPFTTTFKTSRIPTSTSLDAIYMAGPLGRFAGRVSVAGALPPGDTCAGSVYIQTESSDGWDWVGEGELNADGTFLVAAAASEMHGTKYRATYGGWGYVCEYSTSEPRALEFNLPHVSLSIVGRQSAVKVDIDPDQGRDAWAFQVQRSTGEDQWRNVGKYTTRGSRETRTLNLPKGTYRVRVLPRFGYIETYSEEFSLER
jgi:hypothetical protein